LGDVPRFGVLRTTDLEDERYEGRFVPATSQGAPATSQATSSTPQGASATRAERFSDVAGHLSDVAVRFSDVAGGRDVVDVHLLVGTPFRDDDR